MNKRVNLQFILFLTVFIPFINMFRVFSVVSPNFEDFSITHYLNFFAVAFSGYIVLKNNMYRLNRKLIAFSVIVLFLLAVNYLLAPLASIKWLLNWLGFIFIFIVLAQVFCKLSASQTSYIEDSVLKWLFRVSVFSAILFFTLWLLNFDSLIFFISTWKGNHVTAILSDNIGIDKQALGTFYGLFLLTIVAYWKKLSKRRVLFLFLIFLSLLPAMISLRTFHLASTLTLSWLFFMNDVSRKTAMIILAGLVVILIAANFTATVKIVETLYDRLPSIKFAWSAMTDNLFGLGNGGYHIYVEQHEDKIISLFGSERMVERGIFWKAPESDLVYFIASWGVLSIIFFSFMFYLLRSGVRLYHQRSTLSSFERLLLLMSFYMIFSGISQDNAGGLIWWIFMGAGYGVLLRHKRLTLRCQKFVSYPQVLETRYA